MDQTIELIRWSTQPDNNIQRQVYKRVQEYSKDPQFLLNLTSILVGEYDTDLRYRAGIILKSALRYCEQLPQQLQQLVLQCDLNNSLVRQAFCIVLPEYVVRNGFKNSTMLLQYLINQIEVDPLLSSDCLSKIIEDLKFNQENINYYDTTEGLQLIDSLIIKFMHLTQHQTLQVVINALNFLNYNVFFMPPALAANANNYVDILLRGTQSQEQQIRLKCYQGLQALIETKRDRIYNMEFVVNTCVKGVNDSDKEVVRFAELFLTDFLRIDDEAYLQQVVYIKPHLNTILPQLLLNSQITKQDQINLMPSFATTVQSKDVEEEEEQAPIGEYTLRQVSGQLIEKILEHYESESTTIILQLIQELLKVDEWKKKEAALLILGTIANSVMQQCSNTIPQIMTILLNDGVKQYEYALATSIWSISRYNKWIGDIAPSEPQFIQNYLNLLVTSIKHSSILVKESACTALNSLAQDAFFILQPHLLQLFQIYITALNEEGGVLLYIYQSLTTLLGECDEFNNQELADLLFCQLISKIGCINNFDICPVYLECLTIAVEKFGKHIINYIPAIMQATNHSMKSYLDYVRSGITKNLYQFKEILKRSLDLCSQIVNIVKEDFRTLVDAQFLQIIEVSLQDPETDVKQYALAFIGELIKNSYSMFANAQLGTILNDHIYEQSAFCDPSKLFLATSNNAAWALGELAVRDPQQLYPIYQVCMPKLLKLINEPKLPRSIAQNLAISLCRVLSINLQNCQMYLTDCFKRICLILSQTKSEAFAEYKLEAFGILINVVNIHPQTVVPYMKYFIYSMVVSENLGGLVDKFKHIVQQYETSLGREQFDAMFTGSDFPKGFREMLRIYELQ